MNYYSLLRTIILYSAFVLCTLTLLGAEARAFVLPKPEVRNNLLRVFSENITVTGYPYQVLIEQAAARHELPLAYVLAVARGESFFDPDALSAKGAIGLMQVMPATAKGEYGISRQALFDPSTNIDVGVRYLADQYRRFGDPYLALGAYYCGPGGISAKSGKIRNDCDEYVCYINEHLNSILARAHGKDPRGPGRLQKLVVVEFDNYLDAGRFVSHINARLESPMLELFRIETQMADHLRFRYQAVVAYEEETGQARICRQINKASGFSLCAFEDEI